MSAQIPVTQLPCDSDETQYVHLYQSEEKIYTRRVRGFYQRLRRYIASPLLLGYFLLPWLVIDSRPAVLLDLSAQKFHIFWLTLWPQDGLLLAWLLMIAALGLFTVTVLAGRVWCGFSCPQTVWTQMFIWLEDKCEGDRNKRIKLDAGGWSFNKLVRKVSKHFLWWLLALATGFTFVAYFYGARALVTDLVALQINGETVFWLGLFSLATYLNAGWMREQVCKYMCPYARFQSVMYDSNTKTITYDASRGDTSIVGPLPLVNGFIQPERVPRGLSVDHKAAGLGDCIDCSWCVQVCPVDIDIRDGLQADCINCGLCIDACDTVMDRMGYERGLIRFASEQELEGGSNSAEALSAQPKSFFDGRYFPSPRLLGYSLALLLVSGLFVGQLLNRTPLDVGVSRDRGIHLYREYSDRIENVYRVRLGNMSRQQQRYQVSVPPPFELRGRTSVTLEEGEVFSLPLRVGLDKALISRTQQSINFTVTSMQDGSISIEKSASFIAPK